MKRFLVCMAVACAAWVAVEAKPEAEAAPKAPAAKKAPAVKAPAVKPAATNAPAAATNVPPVATQAVAVVAAEVIAPTPEWTGYVRVLRGDAGEVRAVRLVVDDKLVAVDLNEKGRELAASPKTRKMLVKGSLEVRDSRAWLVVTEFKEAPAAAIPELPAAPAPAPAATNVPPAVATNAVPAAATNAPAAPPAH